MCPTSLPPQVYHPSALNGSTASGAAQAHLRSKQALLQLLQARVLDKGAFVRQRALQARRGQGRALAGQARAQAGRHACSGAAARPRAR
jgi:hypothetical protein